jgi:hypothetical protein
MKASREAYYLRRVLRNRSHPPHSACFQVDPIRRAWRKPTEHRLWNMPAQLAAPLNSCVSAPTHPQPARLSSPRTAAARLGISRPKSELVDRGELIGRQEDLHIFFSKNCCARCSTSFLCRASITPAFQRHTAFNVISSADGTSRIGKMRSRSNCMVTVPQVP